jgi:hypothetical protein
MDYPRRLYLILHPVHALIGSQLTPEQLARHYTIGPSRHYRGKVIFAEVDPAFRDPYFDIEGGLAHVVPHEDGRPKATKFISSYRVVEHVDFGALGSLYLTAPSGTCLELARGRYEPGQADGGLSVYAEIAPLAMVVLSRLDFSGFGRFITDPGNAIGAPRFLYTQLDLDLDRFLGDFERNPFVVSPITNLHPSVLRDAILELRSAPYKSNKGLSLHTNLDDFSYRLVRGGFMFASQQETLFYPMPPPEQIEQRNLRFWRDL